MKTAISLPDPLFRAAEQFAQAHGLSRSELFARALQTYLQAYQAHDITETLNQVYTEEDSALEPGVIRAQAQVMIKEDW
jgi:metal-responsive CopG/Arc/MetJ family transcriptional regulator